LLFKNIISQPFKPLKNASKQCNDILQKLLIKNKDKRLGKKGAHEIKNHPWFSEINWEDILK